jgi:hypothetical protein
MTSSQGCFRQTRISQYQWRYSLSVVRLAVYAVVPDETGRLSVQGELADAAPQAMGVPRASVHLQQVLVCDWFRARRAQPVLRLRTTQCQVRALSYCLYRVSIQPLIFQIVKKKLRITGFLDFSHRPVF